MGFSPHKEGKEEKRVKEFILFSYFLKYTNMHTSEAYFLQLAPFFQAQPIGLLRICWHILDMPDGGRRSSGISLVMWPPAGGVLDYLRQNDH
jgi:hypothetical protein